MGQSAPTRGGSHGDAFGALGSHSALHGFYLHRHEHSLDVLASRDYGRIVDKLLDTPSGQSMVSSINSEKMNAEQREAVQNC